MTEKNAVHIRLLAMEGQLEVYVGGILQMQCGRKTEKTISGGVFAFSGSAVFTDMRLYALES